MAEVLTSRARPNRTLSWLQADSEEEADDSSHEDRQDGNNEEGSDEEEDQLKAVYMRIHGKEVRNSMPCSYVLTKLEVCRKCLEHRF